MSKTSRAEARDKLMSGAAWEEFCDRLKALGSEVLRPDVPGGELERAEGYRHLTRILGYALDYAIEHSDVDRPIFHPHPRLSAKWGGDQPDNLYQHAAIDGSLSYRIRGQRGTVHDFVMSASSCGEMEPPGTGGRRGKPSRVFSEISTRDIEFEPDGSFEIVASPDEHPGNWLPTHPDVGSILVRQYFSDWDRQRGAQFFIERVGFEGSSPPPLDPAGMAGLLDDVSVWLEQSRPYWTRWMHQEHYRHPPNTAKPMGKVDLGARALYYGQGRFDVAPGQAVVYESEIPDASYWQVSLLNFWFETLDYANHQSCLNMDQIHCDADGRFRLVIALEDPGVQNWLDPAGHRSGALQYRFLFPNTTPEPGMRTVPLERLGEELPADTPRIGPERRREAIYRRRQHVLRRYHLY
ncbi:MAG: DUF1214 domain-containing protein [Proteobacteria bacterium]|nr:DUF1214 domain-containing protein [Pseudomonadota bacterium]